MGLLEIFLVGIWMCSLCSSMNARVSEGGTATVRTLEQVDSLRVWMKGLEFNE